MASDIGFQNSIISSIDKAKVHQLNLQSPDGYWWYTLEANESISAEAIFLMYFLGEVDKETETGLARHILSTQRKDGTWAIWHGGPPDLSTTVECYWALKLACHGDCHTASRFAMTGAFSKARDFILASGGIAKARVFTKIHLAQFGLVPWDASPCMPSELMLMPTWAPVNIYEFSSWARACIIPLLVIMNKRPVRPFVRFFPSFNLDELFVEEPSKRDWNYKKDVSFLSWERFFIELNKILKVTTRLPFKPFDAPAMKKCEDWICEHIAKTEDIFPALAYGAAALSALGHPNSHPIIRKAIDALKSFQQVYDGDEKLPPLPNPPPQGGREREGVTHAIHQQCCISPVWDTPWQITALLEAGISPDDPSLIKAGKWLITKQITNTYGDWRFKNPKAEPGGWSFEFENEFFPDVDDTIQVLHVLNKLAIPEKDAAIRRGLNWLLSMQNDDGGWGAFDRNQKLTIVNKIPFSDHGACLDPSSPDITGRMLALLGEGESEFTHIIAKALSYLSRTQEDFGGWHGRWGVNYIYGTWCVLTGVSAVKDYAVLDNKWQERIKRAVEWLKSIQHEDGGWSESPDTYKERAYIPYPNGSKPRGVPSQTAWALMGLHAARNVIASAEGAWQSPECNCVNGIASSPMLLAMTRAAKFLTDRLRADGTWDEKEFTGTGFPGHFYIRYHGYRYFFPLLALAKISSALKG
jgi:squalene-hopene/tetraprenyl-beta-curcumene cyclase